MSKYSLKGGETDWPWHSVGVSYTLVASFYVHTTYPQQALFLHC